MVLDKRLNDMFLINLFSNKEKTIINNRNVSVYFIQPWYATVK